MFDLGQIKSEKYISLETYRKNSQPVKTPVWFVIRDDLIHVVTREQTGKVKRLQNNQQVKVALCTKRGKVTGEWVSGTAEVLSGERIKEAVEWRDKKYGFVAKVAKLFSKNKGEFFAFSIKLNDPL